MYDFDEIIDRGNTNSVKYGTGRMMYPGLGDDFIPMWIADMDFACPEPVLDAMRARLDRRILGYSMILDPEYYQALGEWMEKRHDWKVDPKTSLFSSGVITALNTAVAKLTAPADGVILTTPAYHPFDDAIKKHGRTPVYSRLVNKGGQYELDWADFEAKAQNPSNTLYFLCNPHNPTGRVWTEKELRRMGEICFANNVFVVSDEIHSDFTRKGQKHIVFASLFPNEKRIITCTAPSKTFNLAGNQLSNIFFADPELQQEWAGGMLLGHPNPLSIDACQAAYAQCGGWVDALNVYLDENFRHFAQRLSAELPRISFTIPQATYLAWVDMSALDLSRRELARRLVEAGLQVEFEDEFVDNGGGHIRMNLACPRSVVDRAVDALVRAVGPSAKPGVPCLAMGNPLPDFTADTAFGKNIKFSELASGKPTMLLFLRYFGCTVCQLDLCELKENYELVRQAGGQVVVVLQSDPALLASQLQRPDAFPFPIICDPRRTLYERFAVLPAVSMTELSGPKLADKLRQAKAQKLRHGAYEGDEMQLPAAFAVDSNQTLTYVHYGQGVADVPNASEIAALLK